MGKIAIIFSVLILSGCGQTIKKQTEVATICLNDMLTVDKDISDPTNILNGKTEILKLKYIVWGCVCPNWITVDEFEKYQDSALGEHCIFIEPASEDLELSSDFDPFEDLIQVMGQFYVKPDYPKGTGGGEQQPLNKAKVFRYTKIEVL